MALGAKPHYAQPFFCMTLFFYGGYCIYSSYMVLYLNERGYNAFFCGFVTSLTFIISVIVQPLASYLVDTFISLKNYMLLSTGMLVFLALLAGRTAVNPWICIALISAMAIFIMPFGYLLDVWIDSSRELDRSLTYGIVRAGGSVGFGIISVAFGYCWVHFPHSIYFPAQALLFACMFLFLWRFPAIEPKNKCEPSAKKREDRGLTFLQSFRILLGSRGYRVIAALFLLYWMSNRPVGSYLALMIQSRNGNAELFGWVVGAGAVSEAAVMIFLAARRNYFSVKKMLGLAFLTACLRPVILLLTTDVVLLFAAQIIQSISFTMYYVSSVETLHRLADPRIRTFSISIGLAFTNVLGTAIANLAGGWLFDAFGTLPVLLLSTALTAVNVLLFYILANGLVSDFNGCV